MSEISEHVRRLEAERLRPQPAPADDLRVLLDELIHALAVLCGVGQQRT